MNEEKFSLPRGVLPFVYLVSAISQMIIALSHPLLSHMHAGKQTMALLLIWNWTILQYHLTQTHSSLSVLFCYNPPNFSIMHCEARLNFGGYPFLDGTNPNNVYSSPTGTFYLENNFHNMNSLAIFSEFCHVFAFKPNASASLILIRIDSSEYVSNIISVAVWPENELAMNYSLQK